MNPDKQKKRHIISEITFSKYSITCSCGEEIVPMTIAPDDVPWDVLNTVFYEHRKSQGMKNHSNVDLGHSREESKRPFVIKRTLEEVKAG